MEFTEFFQTIFSGFGSKVIIALVIILIGFIIGRITGKLIQGILKEIELNKILEKAGLKISLEEILGHFISYFIYFIAIIMALNQIGVTTMVLNILAGGIILVIIISLLLAFKDFIPNIIAGIFIHQKRYINVGDRIKLNDVQGKIVHINLVETQIQTKDKDIIYIPNSLLTKKSVIKVKKRKKS